MIYVFAFAITVTAIVLFLHWYSYGYLKNAITRRRRWDLNACCGTIDGGGINVDIVRHAGVPNFIAVASIYRLPFKNGAFANVLYSHTIEHVEYPQRLDRELRRAGRRVTYVLPPVWDLAAGRNVFEHRWLFLTARKVHRTLPVRMPLPFARRIQAKAGQRISA